MEQQQEKKKKKKKKLRGRGPEPTLSDSEVLMTMEIVGELLGIDAEKGLYAYFKRHYHQEWFPALREACASHHLHPPDG